MSKIPCRPPGCLPWLLRSPKADARNLSDPTYSEKGDFIGWIKLVDMEFDYTGNPCSNFCKVSKDLCSEDASST